MKQFLFINGFAFATAFNSFDHLALAHAKAPSYTRAYAHKYIRTNTDAHKYIRANTYTHKYIRTNADANAHNKSNIAQFNLICPYSEGKILINTYNFEIGLQRPDILHDQVVLFETVLVELVRQCKECFDITVILPMAKQNYVLLVALRTEELRRHAPPAPLQYSAELKVKNEDDSLQTLMPKMTCHGNSIFKLEDTMSELGPNSRSNGVVQ